MKWLYDKLIAKVGVERIITKFLLFPKKLDNEWRWLEKASIRQKVMKMDVGGSMQWGKYKHQWRDIRWEAEGK